MGVGGVGTLTLWNWSVKYKSLVNPGSGSDSHSVVGSVKCKNRGPKKAQGLTGTGSQDLLQTMQALIHLNY